MKIIQRNDYTFPQPLYTFGQTLIDTENDQGFVVGMRFTSEEWEYQLFYLELETLGSWVKETNLSKEVV